MMRKWAVVSLIVTGFCFLFALNSLVLPATPTITAGMNLPQFTFPTPDQEAQKYLGLKMAKPFSVSEVPGRAMLVEVFYVLCTNCQNAAPSVNKLFSLIQSDADLAKNLKMCGLGIRGNEKRLRAYRTMYHTKFPLLPDPENEIYEKLGEPKIPCLMLVSRSGKVLLTHSGQIEDLDRLFSEIKKLSLQP
jgi:hypothetical protein